MATQKKPKKQRQPIEYQDLHAAADHYEPLMRARFVRAMKQVQKETSINELALLIANHRPVIIDRKRIDKALAPVASVVLNAFLQGGKLGAKRIQRLG